MEQICPKSIWARGKYLGYHNTYSQDKTRRSKILSCYLGYKIYSSIYIFYNQILQRTFVCTGLFKNIILPLINSEATARKAYFVSDIALKPYK